MINIEYQSKLKKYYTHLFPTQLVCNWFGYQPTMDYNQDLHFRQFSFTIERNGQQIYKRFLNYKNAAMLKNSLIQEIPIKIDIGAIMQEQPKKGTNIPKQKQFVLDIDIDDYDNVRTCCQGAKVCNKCWKLMRIASKILFSSMSEDFGFHDMLFVFSGRRGLHLWVCDLQARLMQDHMRRSVMDYLYLVTGNQKNDSQLTDNVIKQIQISDILIKEKFKKNKKTFNTSQDYTQKINIKNYYYKHHIHPLIVRSLRIIQQNFRQILEQQQILIADKSRQIIQKILHNRSHFLKQRVKYRWESLKNKSPLSMYDQMLKQIQIYQRFPQKYKKSQMFDQQQLEPNSPFKCLSFIQQQIQLTFMYPRLDINVSTSKNHLLKCPFSVHPKSLKISVPFSYQSIDYFDPEKCITLDRLLQELKQIQGEQQYRIKNKSSEQISKLTGLNDAIITLESFVKNALRRLNRKLNQQQF